MIMSEKVNAVHTMIEQFVQSVGLTKQQTFNAEFASWHWTRGSAPIEVFVTNGGNDRFYLCIYSALVELPGGGLEAAFKHLLELNHSKLGVKLSLKPGSNWVFAVAERDVNGMDYQELVTCIGDLEWWADKLDDELKASFAR